MTIPYSYLFVSEAQRYNDFFFKLLNFFHSAAEAVVKGQSDSILMFHQQNVPRTKLSQVSQECVQKV